MFMSDVSIIVRKMRLFAEANLVSRGIGFPEQLVIMFLSVHGPCKQETIAEELEIDKGSIAKTIGKLEGKGLVHRKVNPTSRREKIVELLPAANETLEAMHVAHAELDKTLFAGLTPEEIEITCASLSMIAQNLVDATEGI